MKTLNWYAVVGIAGLILDRTFKLYAQGLPIPKNAGVFSFGSFPNPALFFFPAWRVIPYLALVVLVILIIAFIITRKASLLPIIAGGASNVFDRFAYGGVIDVIHIRGLATINLADILILGGLLLLIFKRKNYV